MITNNSTQYLTKGVIPINKPINWTSFDVVNKAKHLLKTTKVGHLGTLDPMATGVLLLTVGKATKLFDLMQEKQKSYLAKFEFGYETDSLDATGKLTQSSDHIPTLTEIEAILPTFLGEIEQLPPKYSAKSVNGVRAYELARQNKEFELKPKPVSIYNIKLISYENKVLTLEISCGSGTYIRAIGRDIAYKLNTYATMTELIRTQVSNFTIKDCKDITTLTDNSIKTSILPIKQVLNYPSLEIAPQTMQKLLNGQTISIEKPNGLYLLNDDLDTIAIIKITGNSAKMSIFLG